ncbi:MAG: glycosyltransferase family 2 protein [Armatimonadota bacterium]
MDVSVIIAAYNEEGCIRKCLRSLLDQTHPSYEIIVADDGSTDRTPDIVQELGVKLINAPHKGPGLARNSAVPHTSGDILVFVDADMSFDRVFLEKLVEPINHDGVPGTFTKEEYVGNWENHWARCWTINCGLPDKKRHPADYPDTDKVFRAIRRDLFVSINGYDDIGYSEDHSISRKLEKLAIHAPGAVCYHDNPGSLTDVYLSARWFGKGDQIDRSLKSITRHTLPFSLKNGILRAVKHRNLYYPLFQMVYDYGVLAGMIHRRLHPESHSK